MSTRRTVPRHNWRRQTGDPSRCPSKRTRPSCHPLRSTRRIAGHIRPRSRQTCFSEANESSRSLPLLDSRGRTRGRRKKRDINSPSKAPPAPRPLGPQRAPAVIPIVGPCIVPAFPGHGVLSGAERFWQIHAIDCVLLGRAIQPWAWSLMPGRAITAPPAARLGTVRLCFRSEDCRWRAHMQPRSVECNLKGLH